MTEPQGGEGQGWTLHLYEDGSGHLAENCMEVCRKDPAAFRTVELCEASLLAVAEAKKLEAEQREAAWIAATDEKITDMKAHSKLQHEGLRQAVGKIEALTEALRVAEERAEKAEEAERIATKNAYDYGEKWNGLREQLVAAERKIEFSERKREEAVEDNRLLRAVLAEAGVVPERTPHGYRWKRLAAEPKGKE